MKTATIAGLGILSAWIKANNPEKKSNPGRKVFSFGISLFFALFVFCGSSQKCLAQEPDSVYKNWNILGEDTANHVDISYRIVQCTSTSANQVHLSVFNENPSTKSVSFTVTIKDNSSNATSTSQISYQVSPAAMDRADCSSSGSLKINIPSGYNPANLTVSITF